MNMFDLVDQRLRFRGTVIYTNYTHIKMNDIYRTDTNEKVSDYARTKINKEMYKLNLKEGDVIEFTATVQLVFDPYVKVQPNKCRFYRIAKPVKLNGDN